MNLDTLFDDVAAFIADSRNLLATGSVIELAGLDGRVKELCEQSLLLPDEARARHAERLQGLLAELHALGEALTERRDALGQEIQSLPQHKKASTAYKIVDASDKKGDD